MRNESASVVKSGKIVGYRLSINESAALAKTMLVFADQANMPGFRIGNKFVPDIDEEIAYTKLAIKE